MPGLLPDVHELPCRCKGPKAIWQSDCMPLKLTLWCLSVQQPHLSSSMGTLGNEVTSEPVARM